MVTMPMNGGGGTMQELIISNMETIDLSRTKVITNEDLFKLLELGGKRLTVRMVLKTTFDWIYGLRRSLVPTRFGPTFNYEVVKSLLEDCDHKVKNASCFLKPHRLEFQWAFKNNHDVTSMTLDVIGIRKDGKTFDVSLHPLNLIADVPIAFRDGVIDSQYELIFPGQVAVTIMDFMRSVVEHLSFWGSPQKRNLIASTLIECGLPNAQKSQKTISFLP